MRIPHIATIWPIVAVTAITALGAYLRLNGLMERDYWYDEAFTGITVRQPIFEMLQIVVNDVHPPLYYLLLKLWTLLAGSGAFSLRFFSVIFGVATIPLAFSAMRLWHRTSWWPAILASLVIAVNPFLVNYSQEARMYSLLGFLVLLVAYLLTLSWHTGSTKLRVLYGATLLALMLTHYLGVVFAVVLVLVDAWRVRRPTAKWLTSAYAVPLVGGLVWLPFFLEQSARSHASLGWVPSITASYLPTSLHILLFGSPVGVLGVPPALGYHFEWLSIEVIGVIVLALGGLLLVWITATRRWNWPLAVTASLAFLPIIVAYLLQTIDLKLYVERYLIGSAVFLGLFFVLASTRLRLMALVVPYFALVALIAPWQYSLTHTRLAEAVKPRLNDTNVIYTDVLAYIVGRFYLGEEHRDQLFLLASEPYNDWALIDDANQTNTPPTTPHLIITTDPADYPGYRQVTTIDDVVILKSL